MKRKWSCASGAGGVAEDSSRKRHKSNNTEETSLSAVPRAILPALPSAVPAPPTDHASLVAVVFHEHILGKVARDILQAKQGRHGDSGVKRCRCIGELLLDVGGPLDMCSVLKGGRDELQLALLLHLEENKPHRWLLRVSVPGREEHLEVKMDARLAGWEAAKVAKVISKTTVKCLRLFLKECGCGSGLGSSCTSSAQLCVEVWALGPIWHVGVASEGGVKLANRSFYVIMVTMLYGIAEYEQEGECAAVAESGGGGGGVSVVTQVKQFYDDVRCRRLASSSEIPLNETETPPTVIPGLLASLRGYQRSALAWMLNREGVGGGGVTNSRQLHPLWKRVPYPASGQEQLFFNPFSAKFSTCFFASPATPRGGILADEMGLGKTVEVLALILSHQWSISHTSGGSSNSLHSAREEDGVTSLKEGGVVNSSMEGGVVDASMEVDVVDSSMEVGVVNSLREGGVVAGGEKCECLCGKSDGGRSLDSWVQCERCKIWQHRLCTEYDETTSKLFNCTTCLLEKPHQCKTTLIICPSSLLHQWSEEIAKHTYDNTLKVMIYPGVASRYRSPFALAEYDIVLASYEVLSSELYHMTSLKFHTNLRHARRYKSFPSPLPALEWWRIVLDEAQMVEGKGLRAVELMAKVRGVNKWCVSGTPIQKGLKDLYGLLDFLGVEPYHIHEWYEQLLWKPFLQGHKFPIVDVFADIMWRNTKTDVADELQLPPLTEHVQWVDYGSVERYYYNKQLETCRDRLRSRVWPELGSIRHLTYRDMAKMLAPLHSLRQACCTPGIVKYSCLPQDLTKKSLVTMDFLLSKLTQQAKLEARESLRLEVMSLNGLAGLISLRAHSLQDHYDVMQCYCKAIELWEEFGEFEVECDSLQRIHTLKNLAELLALANWSSMTSLEDFRQLYPNYQFILDCNRNSHLLPSDEDNEDVSNIEEYSDLEEEDIEEEEEELLDRGGEAQELLDQGGGAQELLDQGGGAQELLDQGGGAQELLDQGGEASELLDQGCGAQDDQGGGAQELLDHGGGAQELLDREGGALELPPVPNLREVQSGADKRVSQELPGVDLGGGSQELLGADQGGRAHEVLDRGGGCQEKLGADQERGAQEILGPDQGDQGDGAQEMMETDQGGGADELLGADQVGRDQGDGSQELPGRYQGVGAQEILGEDQKSGVEDMLGEDQEGISRDDRERTDQEGGAQVLLGERGAQAPGGNQGECSEDSKFDERFNSKMRCKESKTGREQGEESKEGQKLVLKYEVIQAEVKRLCNEYIKREVVNVESAMSMVCSTRKGIQVALDEFQQNLVVNLDHVTSNTQTEEGHVTSSTQTGEGHRGTLQDPPGEDQGSILQDSSEYQGNVLQDPSVEEMGVAGEGCVVQWWGLALAWLKEKLSEAAFDDIFRGVSLMLSSEKAFSLEEFRAEITRKISVMEGDREQFWLSLKEVSNSIHSRSLLEDAICCHLDRDLRLLHGRCCGLCRCKPLMSSYEKELFSSYEEVATRQSKRPGVTERILAFILSVALRNGSPHHVVQAGWTHLRCMKALRKEYLLMQHLWLKLEQLLGKRHELAQASAKLSLNFSNGCSGCQEFHQSTFNPIASCGGRIHPIEVESRMMQWKCEKVIHERNLKKHVGQIVYLNNLQVEHGETGKGVCPICTTEIGDEVGMFPCGHSLCKPCMNTFLHRHMNMVSMTTITCPLCRQTCSTGSIHFVLAGSKYQGGLEGEEEEVEPVNSNHTSKILAVVRTLLKIKRKEPTAKALVFSWWSEVLKHISLCLEENKVKHVFCQSLLQTSLSMFKTSSDVNVVLLPFKLGSKGLNIVEATHVLLVEPQLNLATEVQAIGRVHRIGQTRPTTVQRFIVRDTVEEHIYEWTRRHEQRENIGDTLMELDTAMTCSDVLRLVGGDNGRDGPATTGTLH